MLSVVDNHTKVSNSLAENQTVLLFSGYCFCQFQVLFRDNPIKSSLYHMSVAISLTLLKNLQFLSWNVSWALIDFWWYHFTNIIFSIQLLQLEHNAEPHTFTSVSHAGFRSSVPNSTYKISLWQYYCMLKIPWSSVRWCQFLFSSPV